MKVEVGYYIGIMFGKERKTKVHRPQKGRLIYERFA